MRVIALALTALVAALHVGFMVLEMFYWTEPFGLKTFNQTLEIAKQSAVLAANQAFYDAFEARSCSSCTGTASRRPANSSQTCAAWRVTA